MNDTNYMDNTGACRGDDVLVANETNVTDGASVSGTTSLSVPDTTAKHCKAYILIGALFLIAMMLVVSLDVCATENSVYVDEEYMANKLGGYTYQIIVKNNNDEYFVLASDLPILYEVPTDESKSYFWSTKGSSKSFARALQIVDNKLQYGALMGLSFDSTQQSVNFSSARVTNTFNTIYWSNNDVYSTDGTLVYSINPMPDEDVGSDVGGACAFTDENIVESVNILNENLVAKLDIIITLLIVMIALKMFSPLANNHKRGLDKKEK